MGLRDIWKKYKVLIVMVPGLGLIHLGWYNLKSLAPKSREDFIPTPGIVTHVLSPAAPPAAPKSK